MARVVSIWDLARSSFYAARQRGRQPRGPEKRGPKVRSDEELVTAIRQLLAAPVFSGEGYRKIWARLRHNGEPAFGKLLEGCGGRPRIRAFVDLAQKFVEPPLSVASGAELSFPSQLPLKACRK